MILSNRIKSCTLLTFLVISRDLIAACFGILIIDMQIAC
jgi:hypothetical protein